MPIVKTRTTAFRQSDGEAFVMRINCNGAGRFTIRLPKDTFAVLGRKRVEADRMEDAIKEFHRAMGEFESANQRKEKVIVYKVRSNCYIFEDERVTHKTDEISFCAGTALAVAAAVYEKTITTKADGKQTYRYVRQESTIPKGLQSMDKILVAPPEREVPWTKTQEEFFRRVGLSLETLILKLTDVCADPKLLADAAARLDVKLLA